MYTLPYDPTGLMPQNLVTTPEVHQLELSVATPSSYFIVPKLAPFYFHDVVIFDHLTNRRLELGKDYWFTHRFMDATDKNHTDVYGSISFRQVTGMPSAVRLESYRSMGGQWTLDAAGLLAFLANTLYNPRIASWDQVVDPPEAVPVLSHTHDAETDTGSYFSMIASLDSIAEAIRYMTGEKLPSLEQLGIGNIHNYPLAISPNDLTNGGNPETYTSAMFVVSAINLALSNLSIPTLGITSSQAYPGNLGEATRLAVMSLNTDVTALQSQSNEFNNALTLINYSVPYFADDDVSDITEGKPNSSLGVRLNAVPNTLPMRRSGGDILAETNINEPKSLVNMATLTQAVLDITGSSELPTVAIQALQQRTDALESFQSDQEILNDQMLDNLEANSLDIVQLQTALAAALARIDNIEKHPVVSHQVKGNISGATTFVVADGITIAATATGNTTINFTLPANFDPAKHTIAVHLILTMQATYTITHPTGTIYPNNVAPNLVSGKTYLITYIKNGNANWRMTDPTPYNS